ncbi:MAG: hypoxanthine phosphoribosyltransferase [Oscillospiraceae bacterium]|nr:hypoxanthine phosphoribosyltransferase [Oscillospiraceae bacterium]
MHSNIQKVLISQEQIKARVAELGAQIAKDYQGKDLVFVGVLKGVVVFFSDLVRAVDLPCEFDFMWISSYQGTSSTGSMVVKRDVSADLKGRHVVILEDIFDTGNSLEFTYNHLLAKEPASLRICTFLDKPERRRAGVSVRADYTGFTIPNEFVVGYGMDFNEKYRNLPYIGVLKPEAYEK